MGVLKKIVAPAALFLVSVGFVLFFIAINGSAFGFDQKDQWAFAIYAFFTIFSAMVFTIIVALKSLRR